MNTDIKEIGLFDIIKLIFTDKEKFNSLSDISLKRNYFMINRIFSIKYPLQAMYFSTSGINEAEVIKCWRDFIISKNEFGKVPFWVYTKGSKKAGAVKEKTKKVSTQLIRDYCNHYNINIKDVNDCLEFFESPMLEELKRYESLIKVKNSIEKEKNFSD